MKEKMKLCYASGDELTAEEKQGWVNTIWGGFNNTLSIGIQALPGLAGLFSSLNETESTGESEYNRGVADTSTSNNRMLLIGGISLVLIIVLVIIITSSRK